MEVGGVHVEHLVDRLRGLRVDPLAEVAIPPSALPTDKVAVALDVVGAHAGRVAHAPAGVGVVLACCAQRQQRICTRNKLKSIVPKKA